MSEALQSRLLQTRFEGPHHEALLAVMLANAAVDSMLDEMFDGSGITQPQYNVLRILNGIYPGAHCRSEIARRMVRRAPDLTRMLDRLVRLGLVERAKGERDHRQSMAKITEKGRALLDEMRPKAQRMTQLLADRLSQDEARQLVTLLERVIISD